MRPPHLGDRLQQLVAAGAIRSQRVAGLAGVRREREQQMLGRDIFVVQRARLVLGRAQDLDELSRAPGELGRPGPRISGQLRQRLERGADRLAHGARLDAELAKDGNDDAGVGFEQHREQMLRRRLRIAAPISEPLRGLKRLLGLDRKAVGLHMGL